MSLLKDYVTYEEGSMGQSFSATLSLSNSASTGDDEKINWKLFFEEVEVVYDKVCCILLSSDLPRKSLVSLPSQAGTSDRDYVHSLMKVLDIRPETSNKNRENLHRILWVKLIRDISKLLVLVLVFLSIVFLLLGFNALWKETNPRDTNSLLLTILIVPLYTFARTRLNPASLTSHEKLLASKIFDTELKQCLAKAKSNLPVSTVPK